MLTESKFRKYLLYAFGEVMLVVIGILIALQINNWNESKKLNTQLHQYKDNLIAELDKDIKAIDSLTSFRLECKKSVLAFVEYYSQEAPDIDTLIAKKKCDASCGYPLP